ncbi:ribose 5-phosphate isomerase A-like protein [Paenibacillus larvae subsp. larvae B-3650]|nr:putative DNA-binding protein [Paenibacillus larvae]PCK71356.1 ribose 5-phosphate isomerase A-like protein [Paenibacillus larvae subsp. larvae B-3650]
MTEAIKVTEDEVLAKTNRINLLFDFYEPLLTEKQRTFLKLYFHDDYSLGEIAENFNISRQAVYEHIKRAEGTLQDYEKKLKLLAQYQARSMLLQELMNVMETAPAELRQRADSIINRFYALDEDNE